MPPHQYTSRGLEAEIGMSVHDSATTLTDAPNVASINFDLPLTVAIIVALILVAAVLLMPEGFFLNLASKRNIKSGSTGEHPRRWFGYRPSCEKSTTDGKCPSTFVARHLATLRAWEKPTEQSQLPLPLHRAKLDAVDQPHRPFAMTFQEWQERQRNAIARPNPMHEFKLIGTGIHSPAYWKNVEKEMEARKPSWEMVKDKLHIGSPTFGY